MHLLVAQKGTIGESDEAIDLGQSPGDILFLSAADSEIAAIAAAYDAQSDGLSLRVASLLDLKHPMSVDTYIERTARHAKLIVVRALGGASYFQYVLEALHACAMRYSFKIAVLPGDAKPDPGISHFSNISHHDLHALWSYLMEGGDANMRAFLRYAGALISGDEKPGSAAPLMKAGIWWPGRGIIGIDEWNGLWAQKQLEDASIVAVSFYRALLQSGETRAVESLVHALMAQGLRALPVFAYSLKDPVSKDILSHILARLPPCVVINTTGFAVSTPGEGRQPTVLEANDAVVLQAVFSSSPKAVWQNSSQGLSARDLGMNVVLPEIDGRVLARAVSFKAALHYDKNVEANIVCSEPDEDRVHYVAQLAAGWARLRQSAPSQRRIALVLANYPDSDGRIGNGVGLDTPAGTIEIMKALHKAGYDIHTIPLTGDELIKRFTAREHQVKAFNETLSLNQYKSFFQTLPVQIQDEVCGRWGAPEDDPKIGDDGFTLPVIKFGALLIGIQPARGYGVDPKETYHSPDLVPPHSYFAFYAYLRFHFKAHAVIHMGKHGNLEWLPGKALALSAICYPEAILGPLPHLYPFIVNDPGEGTQAKRRTSAVIIDHLTPPLTRAESYGALKHLESMVDEYYEATGGDPRRVRLLRQQILDLAHDIGLGVDAGVAKDESEDEALRKLDAYLCDLKEMQIRNGLHIFGLSPEGVLLTDLTAALARVPRGLGDKGDQSLQRAMAQDLNLNFDPLDCEMAAVWDGVKPSVLAEISSDPWRSAGDTVERIEMLAAKLIDGSFLCPENWLRTRDVLMVIEQQLKPALTRCGPLEIEGLLKGLDGRFVPPGPSGAPTRGRLDVLPTGRNFYSVDIRAVPTPTAYALGSKSAELLVRRYVQDHGEWPVSMGLTAWGTSNMRTGGDDIAQALALIGVKPLWDMTSRRVTGYEIIPLAKLGRPRVDVTLRISGFFRDAFPEQIALFDKAIRAVGDLQEEAGDNPIADRMRLETTRLQATGLDKKAAIRRAGYRVFGSKPGAYGAGLQTLIHEKAWEHRADLAEAYLAWGSYAYGAEDDGQWERDLFEKRLQSVQAVIHNQDNREHDLLDSDEYYQFEGGMAATAEQLSGVQPIIYHNDHSRPEKPVIRSLDDEIGRVVRARVVNPKWIAGVMRHGYKGAFEIAATVDYLFAFAATTGAVRQHHFEAVYQAFVVDQQVRDFMAEKNPTALRDLQERLLEAIERQFWTPRSNSAHFDLKPKIETA